ncbi:MBL fold metallo-hydrolase [Yimella sp. cx-51]|uniref:MBL fold metallo-hydrolase n=1 Tax=Yimella sp. cx-51 TaxID=2770551 RepID=UPI00165D5111|nr:MBL fold metallo-hydrolase [Yimella sp. cx-51]MBC9957439.1 MBL fold metallo-hydrolase [Yimella sp. cx-51]QTH39322.1 MBL fold metallo-hydrolase [Yimella sp. cx-51]
MNYDGKVEPGGPAQVLDTGNARITKRSVGSMSNNAYLVQDAATGAALLIDAAADWPLIEAMISEADARVVGIATTHRHFDHVGALAEAKDALAAPTLAGADDADEIEVPTDRRLTDGDTIPVGDLTITCTHVRGHTPGSIAYSFAGSDGRSHLFSGDTLFPGGVGATDHYDYQSFPQLIDDVEERLFGCFDDSTAVYPGHGNDTTIGTERPALKEWRARGW